MPLPSQLAGRAADHVLRRQRRRRRGRDACGASSSGSGGGGGGGCQQCELIHTLSFQSQPIHVLSRTTSTSSKHMQYTQEACARASINHSPFSLLPLTSPQSATTTCTRVWPPPCEGGAKNASLFSQLFLCFSRACLGKKIAYIYIYRWLKKREGRFSHRSNALDRLDHGHTVRHAAEDDVLAVKPGGDRCCEEELRAVRVPAGRRITHARAHARICIHVSERDET